MKSLYHFLLINVLLFTVFRPNLFSQTTGKIAGTVVDADTGDPLPGANVIVVGTNRGAATTSEGDFFILNVPPGTYTVRIEMMGFKSLVMEDVRVSVNRTSEIDARLTGTTIMGEEVVVIADKVAVKKDQTSSIRNISSEQMDVLPTESVDAVVNMQPGVVLGHFRGGRANEVTYLVDGMQVDEAFGRGDQTVNVEKDVVEEVEVITGVFSAKYGNAMSGVVNAVTRDGGNMFHGSLSAQLANYYTPHDDIFIGLKNSELDRRKDFKAALNGPIVRDILNFALYSRYQQNDGHLNGIRRFLPDDYSYFLATNPDQWYSEHNGDNAYVPMNWDDHLNFWGKLTFKPMNNIRASLQYILNDDESQGHNHYDKYKPDGRAVSHHNSEMYALQLNHMLTSSAFYEFKVSYVKNYNGNYVYENPTDGRYVHDQYAQSGGGFATGGQDKGHLERWLNNLNAKLDYIWQVQKNHSLVGGLNFTSYDLDNSSKTIRNAYEATPLENVFEYDPVAHKRTYLYYEPVVRTDSSTYSDIYRVKPIEFSGYLEDKMEFDEMVINLGIRLDYFDPKITYPSQWRNPSNQLNLQGDRMSVQRDADPKYQLSPRLGISYQLGEMALLRFGYGHFLQLPPMYAMYDNHARLVPPQNWSTTMGNPQIEAQKTIQYEIGLWQQLSRSMSLDVSLFYRDIYDLQSAKVITTYNQIRYGLYTNIDYANARGLEVKYEFIAGGLSAVLNYTLQFSRGNADNPTSTFTRAGANMDPVNKLIPMSWDQRHTFNASLGYNTGRYGTTLSLYYNSGHPYTWSPMPESPLSRVNLFPNNSHIPSSFSVDLTSYYKLMAYKGMQYRLTLLVYNLFDRLNEVFVNSTTGRAYTAILREIDIANHRSDFNDVYDSIQNPAMYSAPRQVKVGLEVSF